jgi:hypothetical protein
MIKIVLSLWSPQRQFPKALLVEEPEGRRYYESHTTFTIVFLLCRLGLTFSKTELQVSCFSIVAAVTADAARRTLAVLQRSLHSI